MTAVIDPAEQETGSRFDRLIKSDKVHGSRQQRVEIETVLGLREFHRRLS